MAVDCRAHQQGEIIPIIFEVYSENGTIFNVRSKKNPNYPSSDSVIDGVGDTISKEDFIYDNWAYCVISDDLNQEKARIAAELLEDQPSVKKFLVSWDTKLYSEGYYLLKLWCKANFTGATDTLTGDLKPQMEICSDEIQRFIRS